MNKDSLRDAAIAAGLAGVGLGAGYADLQQVKKSTQKESEEKNAGKVEELKRKEGPTGSDKSSAQPMVTKKKGGKVSSASKRADGCAIRGKTKGKML